MYGDSGVSARRRRVVIGGLALVVMIYGFWAMVVAYRYDVPVRDAAVSVTREVLLDGLALAVNIYDPSTVVPVRLGPGRIDTSYVRFEDAMASEGWASDLWRVVPLEVDNARILRAPWEFRHQPHDEPRLHELRQRYGLDQLMAAAPSEFEGMVRLRHWARTQFARRHYQRKMANFDALEILTRGERLEGLVYEPDRMYDPCHFFPLFLAQLLASVGHTARLVSVTHGMTEVWSNQYAKWVLFDAELDLHYEREGIPLSMLELAETDPDDVSRLVIVASPREDGQENPTMVFLGQPSLRPGDALGMFKESLEITELRNDWMTNHYFRGHPSRGEASTLVITPPGVNVPRERQFVQRLRPHAADPSEAYWTQNQAEIHTAPVKDGTVPLSFDTMTPNFAHFEVVVDGKVQDPVADGRFTWRLHDGENSLIVRPVNAFGVRGIASTLRLRADRASADNPRD
jgi:hypothetical protein